MAIVDEFLREHTDDALARPIPAALGEARREVLASAGELATIRDAVIARAWRWTGESEEEVRYGFYRVAELFETAEIDAAALTRARGIERGRAADRIAPATAAAWDLRGLLLPLTAETWDADPGGGEWTVRRTMGHVIGGQRGYGIGSAWWLAQGYAAADLTRPAGIPDEIWDLGPTEEQEAEGTPAEVLERLTAIVDGGTERFAGLPPDGLAVGARWGGFAVDIDFRLGRWSSHIREHAIQVEKTFDMLGHRPTEVDRLVRLVLAAWGRAEAVVTALPQVAGGEEIVAVLGTAAAEARAVAAEVAALAEDP